jgi:predicted transcriptional regulator
MNLKIGSEELRLLRLIAERGPTTVREASETYGSAAGVRLTTVGQMMERLRKKGLLHREQDLGTLRYTSTVTSEELLEGVVREFVQNSLGGSISPFALYLAGGGTISDEELAELRRTLDDLGRSK